MEGFWVRDRAKAHGTQKLIEGNLKPGSRVVIVEDVITTGGSAARAVEAVKRAGAIPVAVLALVDREEGGREQLELLGLPVQALTTVSEIIPHIAPV